MFRSLWSSSKKSSKPVHYQVDFQADEYSPYNRNALTLADSRIGARLHRNYYANELRPGKYKESEYPYEQSSPTFPVSSLDSRYSGFEPSAKFILASSPIQTSALQKVGDSPFDHGKSKLQVDHASQKENSFTQFQLASDVFKLMSAYVMKSKKDIQDVTEEEVLSVLLSNIINTITTPMAYKAFLEFTISEYTDESLRFYKDTLDASKKYRGILPIEIAKSLCDKFIMVGAPDEVNLSCQMRESICSDIENALVTESGYVDVSVFDEAMTEALKLLDDQSFLRFKRKVLAFVGYAPLIWRPTYEIDKSSLQQTVTEPLYNLFLEISMGLRKLKEMINLAKGAAKSARFQRYDMSMPIVHDHHDLLPSKMRDLKFSDY